MEITIEKAHLSQSDTTTLYDTHAHNNTRH